jgi:hypothetical protein
LSYRDHTVSMHHWIPFYNGMKSETYLPLKGQQIEADLTDGTLNENLVVIDPKIKLDYQTPIIETLEVISHVWCCI